MILDFCTPMMMLSLVLTASLLGSKPSYAAADSVYFAGKPAAALAQYRVLLQSQPTDTALLWRASRAALATGWLESNQPVSVSWYHVAQQYARAAVAQNPHDINAQYWLAVSLGREAQVINEPHACVRKAEEAYTIANHILAVDPDNAGAHNLLGQIHYQVMQVPWPVRVVGLRLIGARIKFHASWELAEEHLLRAAQLEPHNIAFHLELGRYYAKRGQRSLAREQFRSALALSPTQPPETMFQQEAAALLKRTY